MADLEPQPAPDDARCPKCGGEPSDVSHRLFAIGYLHDDQTMVCVECGHQWTCGVPIGEFDRPEMAEELECGACDRYKLVHRVEPHDVYDGAYLLHLKCPDCKDFHTVRREPDEKGCILVGYPQITGQTEGAEPRGYPE